MKEVKIIVVDTNPRRAQSLKQANLPPRAAVTRSQAAEHLTQQRTQPAPGPMSRGGLKKRRNPSGRKRRELNFSEVLQMKRIIHGALYNTETAKLIGSWEPNGYDQSNFDYFAKHFI